MVGTYSPQNSRDSRTSTGLGIFLTLAVLMSACAARAQQAGNNWKQVCTFATVGPPRQIEPRGPLSKKELEHCDETALYYGTGGKPNYAAALQCGWYQRAHPHNSVGNMFYGPGVLTMLYANGKGVRRDYNLAIRFACENEWASEGEMAGRIAHLEKLKATGPHGKNFDMCDDITSGLSDGACTNIQTRARDAIRAREVAAILARLSPAAKSVFPSLQAAETAFEESRVDFEVDLSGTSRAAFQLEEEAKLRDQFLANLRQFSSSDVPAASASDLSSLDNELNKVYQQIQHSPASKWKNGTVKPEGIRNTEDKWELLVKAWATFAQVAFPNLPTARVRAQLIRLRLHQLQYLEKWQTAAGSVPQSGIAVFAM